MTAELIRFPRRRIEYHTLDAIEQRDREVGGYLEARRQAPPRTRPLMVIDNGPRYGVSPAVLELRDLGLL